LSRYLRTSDLARAVGVHPNTVRKYADAGLLPPVDRTPAGYRRFTRRHLDCLRLVRLVYNAPFPGPELHSSGVDIIRSTVAGELGKALELAYQHMVKVHAEQAQAEAAVALLERWAQGVQLDATGQDLTIGQTARLLGVTVDVLRNWERNGLIKVPRNPANGYRRYSAAQISRLRVIRLLRLSGYSLMAILRMMTRLDQGHTTGLRQALDTPRPDEDVFTAADRWLSTLEEQAARAGAIISLLEEMIAGQLGESAVQA
jgi:DNA-binding transcriptional MerR regulator